MSTTPRVIGYLRVSTDEQAESGLGLDAQRAMLETEIAHRGWQTVDIVEDAGKTGSNLDRPALKRALRAIARREADVLMVTKLDRISRSSADTAVLCDWMHDARASLVALDLPFDTGPDSPFGQAMLSFMAIVAQLERDLGRQRTRAALAALRARGMPTGRPAVADNVLLVRRIQDLKDEGLSLQAIADRLNADGVPTVRGAAQWTKSSVRGACGYVRPPARRKRANLPRVR